MGVLVVPACWLVTGDVASLGRSLAVVRVAADWAPVFVGGGVGECWGCTVNSGGHHGAVADRRRRNGGVVVREEVLSKVETAFA